MAGNECMECRNHLTRCVCHPKASSKQSLLEEAGYRFTNRDGGWRSHRTHVNTQRAFDSEISPQFESLEEAVLHAWVASGFTGNGTAIPLLTRKPAADLSYISNTNAPEAYRNKMRRAMRIAFYLGINGKTLDTNHAGSAEQYQNDIVQLLYVDRFFFDPSHWGLRKHLTEVRRRQEVWRDHHLSCIKEFRRGQKMRAHRNSPTNGFSLYTLVQVLDETA